MSSGLTFYNGQWWIVALLALALLLPLGWASLRARSERGFPWGAFAARALAVCLLGASLLDPRLVSQRPIPGANTLAILADNSESLSVKDRLDGHDRGELMREWLSGSSSSWIGEAESSYQVRHYLFDRGLRRASSLAALDFRGDRSNLAGALADLGRRLERTPLTGVLLFTDGNATDLENLPEDLSGYPPIYPVAVGENRPAPDIAVTNLQLRQTAFDDAPMDATAFVSTRGFEGERMEVTLSRLAGSRDDPPSAPTLIDRQRIRAGDDRETRIRFQWRSNEPGIQFFQVEARPDPVATEAEAEPEREATLRNNRRLMAADGGKSAYRILYLAGRPNWEYKFLNRALADDPQLDLISLMRIANREPKFDFKGRSGESSNPLYRGFGREEETERYDQPVLIRLNTRDERELAGGFPSSAEELFRYDAIIIDDLEADFFTFSQLALLREFVNQRGGGLLLLGGAGALDDGGYRGSPLESAFPVYLESGRHAPAVAGRIRWQLTREGWVEPWARVRPVEADETRRLASMPDFQVLNALPRVKPGARALAVVESATGERYPALVTRNFGAGRVACIAVGDLWRWGQQGPDEQRDLARFWRQTARWLVTDAPQQIELRSEITPDGSVRLQATARDASYRPLEMGSASLTIRRVSTLDAESAASDSGFEAIELGMDPVPGQPGLFASVAPLRDAGAYRATVDIADPAGVSLGRAETGWVTEPAAAEFASIAPNRALLERLADETGGRLLEPAELSSITQELAQRPSPHMETWSEPLWHSYWYFLLALGCLVAEWALRRRRGYA